MQHVILTGTDAVTDATLIADPGDGRKIVIFGLHVGAAGACIFTVEHGSTTLFRAFATAQQGDIRLGPNGDKPSDRLWEAPASTAVTYTTSSSPDQMIEAWYEITAA